MFCLRVFQHDLIFVDCLLHPSALPLSSYDEREGTHYRRGRWPEGGVVTRSGCVHGCCSVLGADAACIEAYLAPLIRRRARLHTGGPNCERTDGRAPTSRHGRALSVAKDFGGLGDLCYGLRRDGLLDQTKPRLWLAETGSLWLGCWLVGRCLLSRFVGGLRACAGCMYNVLAWCSRRSTLQVNRRLFAAILVIA